MGLSQYEKNLTRRYLIWCYKTTREDLDRIERYFTQFKVDQRILALLKKEKGIDPQTNKLIDNFEIYMHNKHDQAKAKKFLNLEKKELQPEFWYLQQRLYAIEMVIAEVLSVKELKRIQSLYETEMTNRILQAREHT